MKLIIEMGPGFDQTLDKLGAMSTSVLGAVSAGLKEGVEYAAGHVVDHYLSGQYLNRRTGLLAKSVDGWMEGPLHGVIGVPDGSPADDYAWLLGDEEKTIVPKNSKYLAIPIGEGLTPAGVPRYKSPRDVTDGFFVRTASGNLLFGRKRGKRGKFRPLFIMKKSVFVQGTGALIDGVMESLDNINDSIQKHLDREVN